MRVPSVDVVGMGDSAVVLLFGLVHRSRRLGVSPSPERLNETRSLVLGLEGQEDIPLPLDNDVDHFLFKPLPVLGREAVHPLVGENREAEREQKDRRDDTDYQEVPTDHGRLHGYTEGQIPTGRTSPKKAKRPAATATDAILAHV